MVRVDGALQRGHRRRRGRALGGQRVDGGRTFQRWSGRRKCLFFLSSHLGWQDRRFPWSPGLVRAVDGSTGRSSSPSPFSCRAPAIAEEPEPVQRTWPGWDVQLSIKTHLNQLSWVGSASAMAGSKSLQFYDVIHLQSANI